MEQLKQEILSLYPTLAAFAREAKIHKGVLYKVFNEGKKPTAIMERRIRLALKEKKNSMEGYCYLCGRWSNLEEHHVYGASRRKKSTKYKAVVKLCHWCHNEEPDGVHHNKENRLKLQAKYQYKLMKENGWTVEDFIREFGKSYV